MCRVRFFAANRLNLIGGDPVRTLRGKRALVTGAAGGIGRAIALALAREGTELFLVDIDEPRVRESAREAAACGARVHFEICDVSSSDEISRCIAGCIGMFHGLDILVNSAGVLRYGIHYELDADSWKTVMSVNLLAPMQFV